MVLPKGKILAKGGKTHLKRKFIAELNEILEIYDIWRFRISNSSDIANV